MSIYDKLLVSYLEPLDGYYFEIGIISQTTKRKATVEITNAEILFINEHGSPLQNIPARPVLQKTIEWAKSGFLKDEYSKAFEAYLSSSFNLKMFEKSLKQTAVRIQTHAQELIYANDGTFQDNAPSTIKRKGFNHPLLQTGQLARSIICRLCKDGKVVN